MFFVSFSEFSDLAVVQYCLSALDDVGSRSVIFECFILVNNIFTDVTVYMFPFFAADRLLKNVFIALSLMEEAVEDKIVIYHRRTRHTASNISIVDLNRNHLRDG